MGTSPIASGACDAQRLVAIERLGITEDELIALRRQGYIQRDERRAGTSSYARLRFRFQGRMRTIYLGTNQAFIGEVHRELESWRASERTKRNLARVVSEANQSLRRAKLKLAPIIAEMGYHFHGDCIRRLRSASRSDGSKRD